MQKLTYLLTIKLVLTSCGNIEDQALTETPLIAGEQSQAGVAYQSIGMNYLFSDVQSLNGLLSSKVDLDLDKDGQADLQFELSTGINEDIQMLMVRSQGTTLIPQQAKEHHAQVNQAGSIMEPNRSQWLNNEWLFLYYAQNSESWMAAPMVQQSGFLPIHIEGKEGWLEIQVLMNAEQTQVWGLNVKQVALKSLH